MILGTRIECVPFSRSGMPREHLPVRFRPVSNLEFVFLKHPECLKKCPRLCYKALACFIHLGEGVYSRRSGPVKHHDARKANPYTADTLDGSKGFDVDQT